MQTEKQISLNDKVWEIYKVFVLERYKDYLVYEEGPDLDEIAKFALSDANTVVETYFNTDVEIWLDVEKEPLSSTFNARNDRLITVNSSSYPSDEELSQLPEAIREKVLAKK